MTVISVLMPVYNAGPFLRESVGSILNQSFTDLELLICDDASSDDSYEILSQIKDSRIKLFRNDTNQGNLKTCNFLITKATGKYIAIQDADDYSHDQRLALQVDALEQQGLDFVGSQMSLVSLTGKTVRTIQYPLTDQDIKTSLETQPTPPFCWATILFKRELYDRLGFFDPRFNRINAADYDWLYRASEGAKMANIDQVLYFYRLNPNGISKMDKVSNPLALYSEDLARELFLFRRLNKGADDTDFFEERCLHYRTLFEHDKSRFFSKTVYKLAISNERFTLMQQFFVILFGAGGFQYKWRALALALVFILIGYGGAQRLKSLRATS